MLPSLHLAFLYPLLSLSGGRQGVGDATSTVLRENSQSAVRSQARVGNELGKEKKSQAGVGGGGCHKSKVQKLARAPATNQIY